MQYRGFELYPFQARAISALEENRSVLVSAPTGAGKTVIAEYAIERGLRTKSRVVYTSPIKALSNQKYRDFSREWGHDIGLMTGDVTIDADAPVQIMTTEIFRNTIFESPDRLRDVAFVIMDEIHYISDPDRGTVWEESIIFAPPGIHFVGLSATISNLPDFRTWMERVRREPVELVHTDERPVPLVHEAFVPGHGVARISELKEVLPRMRGRGRGRHDRSPGLLSQLEDRDLLPCLFFCFSRRECEMRAHRSRGKYLLDRQKSRRILEIFDEVVRSFGNDPSTYTDLRELAARGVLFHHAGMLPLAKELVERLFTTGMVRVLFTTETFALGVNMPARTVVFASLRKYDGVSFEYMPTLDYYQMAGRAGRLGLDDVGHVFSIIDPTEDTPKGVKDVVFGRIAPLKSCFNLSYSAILNLLRTLGQERLHAALDESFSAFLKGGRSSEDHRILTARVRALEKHGYLLDGELTGKGRIASRLNAYEVQITEIYWAGLFDGLSPGDCAVLLAAVIHSPRKGEDADASGPSTLGGIPSRARSLLAAFRKSELSFGIEQPLKNVSFGLSRIVQAWTEGVSFDRFFGRGGGQPGDLVRNLRMTVQVLRQFAQSVPDDEALTENLWQAFELVNRDEVDAEAQIRRVAALDTHSGV